MILESDIFLIVKAFFPENNSVYVLDPGKNVLKNYETPFRYITKRDELLKLSELPSEIVLLNLSGATTFSFPVDFRMVEGIISFNPFPEYSPDFYQMKLFYIRDDKKAINWIISEKHRKTDFLTETDTQKSIVDVNNFFSVIPNTFKYLKVKFGFLKSVTNGMIQVYTREKFDFKQVTGHSFSSFSVLLSGALIREVVTLSFYKNGKEVFRLKRPLSKKGSEKLKNEGKIIDAIRVLKLSKGTVPGFTKLNSSNVLFFSSHFTNLNSFQIHNKYNSVLLNHISELYLAFRSEIQAGQLLNEEKVDDYTDFLKLKVAKRQFPRGISLMNFTSLFTSLLKIYNHFDRTVMLPVSLVNTDLYLHQVARVGEYLTFLNWENGGFNKVILHELFTLEFKYFEEKEFPEVETLVSNIKYLQHLAVLEDIFDKKEFSFQKLVELFMIIYLPKELTALFSKKLITPEENRKIYIWNEFLRSFQFPEERTV